MQNRETTLLAQTPHNHPVVGAGDRPLFAGLVDPALPGLGELNQVDIARITGTPGARLLRARYQPGKRAVLHVSLGPDSDGRQGAIWFIAGSKAEKLAKEAPGARFDPASGALFQAFPQDHHLPALAMLASRAGALAPQLIGGPAAGPPSLVRYRPGLSATFRWMRADGKTFYLKMLRDIDVQAIAHLCKQLRDALGDGLLGVAGVSGTASDLGAIAFDAAIGQPLESLLSAADAETAIRLANQSAMALQHLSRCKLPVAQVTDREVLLRRAGQACAMAAVVDPVAGKRAAALLDQLRNSPASLRQQVIHGDMKPDHLFISSGRTMLIDMENLSMGDPDYDLAKLEARIVLAGIEGRIGATSADAAINEIRRHAGPNYDWLLTCARLQSAKFLAQHMNPALIPGLRQVLGP